MYGMVILTTLSLMFISADTVDARSMIDTDNQHRKIHLSFGYSLSFNSTTKDIMDAFYASGFTGTNSFGTLFPYDKSRNRPWNIEISYRWVKRCQAGIGVRSIPREEIHGYGGRNLAQSGPEEKASGTTYYLIIDYLLRPFDKRLWSKWELSAGIGLSYSSVSVEGDMGTYYQDPNIFASSEPWRISEKEFGGVIRANLDYYFTSSSSIQLNMSGHIIPSLDVPSQSFYNRVLESHSVNFSTFDMALRLAIHL